MKTRRHFLVALGASITGAVAGCSSSGDAGPANTTNGTPVHTYTEYQPNETEVTVETPNGTTTVTNETTPTETTTTPKDTTTTPGNTTTPEDTVTPHDYEPSQITAGDIHAQRLEESKPSNIDPVLRDINLEEIKAKDTRREQLTELGIQASIEAYDRDAAADAINYIAQTELDWTNENNFRGNHTRFYNGGPGDWTQLLYKTQNGQKRFDAFSPQAGITDKQNMIQNLPGSKFFSDDGDIASSSFDKSFWQTGHQDWGQEDWEQTHEDLHQVLYGDAFDQISYEDGIAPEDFEIGFTEAGYELLESEFENFDGWKFLDHINEEYEKARQGVQEYEHALEDDEFVRIDANTNEVDSVEDAEFLYDIGELEEWDTGAGMAPSPS
ncbi:hypothetical protein [Halorhabdus sp. CUG00001]|uniref:hypothetical protein n=1 Tax=Halorhabdus sp. CUG00001 TaxID=2600297 RepID=UPI00131E2170|nr:hypothetical protein [Halorhabdus sp. CUG00001]